MPPCITGHATGPSSAQHKQLGSFRVCEIEPWEGCEIQNDTEGVITKQTLELESIDHN